MAGRVLGKVGKLGDLSLLELREEARVGGPEEPDVGHREEHHRQALEAQPKRPADVVMQTAVVWTYVCARAGGSTGKEEGGEE